MTSYAGSLSATKTEGTTRTVFQGSVNLADVTIDAEGIVTGRRFILGYITVTTGLGTPQERTNLPYPVFPGVAIFTTTLADMDVPLALDGFGSFRFPGFQDTTLRGVSGDWSRLIDADAGEAGGTVTAQLRMTLSSPLFRLDPVELPTPAEGAAGPTAHVFDIVREGDLAAAASVAWSVTVTGTGTGANPADAADFAGGVLPSGTATFAAGQASIRITVPVAGDIIHEADETYAVRLDIAENDLIVLPHRLDATIANDDASIRLDLFPLDADRPEGNGPATAFTFLLTRAGNLDQSTTIDWSVQGTGPAPARPDNFIGTLLPTGRLTFAPGETSAIITVPVAGNTTGDQDRGFQLTARVGNGEPVWGTNATDTGLSQGTIRNDDAPPAPAELGAVIGGEQTALVPSWYAGPVAELEKEITLLDRGDIAITAYSDNWFIRTGAGTDAIAASGGINVVDGGTGSNFLSGQGAETFFLDARGLATATWSTVLALDPRDAVTVWLDDAIGATLHWADDLGAEGYRGLTLMVEQPGRPLALLTLPGFTTADVGTRLLSDRGTTIDNHAFLSLRLDPA